MTPIQIYTALSAASTSGPFPLVGLSAPLLFMPIAVAIASVPKPVNVSLSGLAGVGVAVGTATITPNIPLTLSVFGGANILGPTALSMATVLSNALASIPWTFTGPLVGVATGTGTGAVSVVPQTLIAALAASLPPSVLSGPLSVAVGNAVCQLFNSAVVNATALGSPVWPPAPAVSTGSYLLV